MERETVWGNNGSILFKKNVLSKSLQSLLEMNVGVSKAGLCDPEGSAVSHTTQC